MPVYVWIVLGVFAGGLASLVMGERRGFLVSTFVGVIGALLGGFLLGLFGQRSITGLNLWSFLVALVGAIVLIAFFRAIRGPQVT